MRNSYGYNVADPFLYSLLKAFAKENKKYPTEAEAILWERLRANRLGKNRTEVLQKMGFWVIRFSNEEIIYKIENVIQDICKYF